MDADAYNKAVKTSQTKVVKKPYMVINFSYGLKVIMPYEKGIALLATMENVEEFDEAYSGVSRIRPIDRSKLNASIMSSEEYQQYKVAALLNVPVTEIQEYEKQAA